LQNDCSKKKKIKGHIEKTAVEHKLGANKGNEAKAWRVGKVRRKFK